MRIIKRMDIANEKKTPLMITGQSSLKFRATLDWDPHQSLDKIKPHPDEAPRQQIQFSSLLTKLVFVQEGDKSSLWVKNSWLGTMRDPYLLYFFFSFKEEPLKNHKTSP